MYATLLADATFHDLLLACDQDLANQVRQRRCLVPSPTRLSGIAKIPIEIRNGVDNTSVIVAAGTGPEAVISLEMVAFAPRWVLTFAQHHLGHSRGPSPM